MMKKKNQNYELSKSSLKKSNVSPNITVESSNPRQPQRLKNGSGDSNFINEVGNSISLLFSGQLSAVVNEIRAEIELADDEEE